jgi:hypothetical protein
MSGPNDNMNWVATVVQGLDGNDATLVPYNWTCPDVHPYGPIYFYQFTQEGQPAQWTTRFTVCILCVGAGSISEHYAFYRSLQLVVKQSLQNIPLNRTVLKLHGAPVTPRPLLVLLALLAHLAPRAAQAMVPVLRPLVLLALPA